MITPSTPAPDAAPWLARRRYLTILFSDLSDSTRLATTLEAEHYAEMIGALRRVAEDVVPAYGGVIVRQQGDGLLIIFGHPDTREDDARRATEAALDLHQRVRDLAPVNWPLPEGGLSMHSGLHAGLVLLQEGDLVLGRFELLGNAANIAARLAALAAPDEVLVGEQTLGPQAAWFACAPPQALQLKGISEPLRVVSVRGRAVLPLGFEARARRGEAPFVGREGLLGQLQARLDAAAGGQGGLVVLCAPPGLGKTRLAEEFLRRSASGNVQLHRAWCPEQAAEPLHPVLQMLRALLDPASGQLAQRLAALAPELIEHEATLRRVLLRDRGAADGQRAVPLAQLLPLLVALFAALARQQVQLLFIDDWQWADDATRQVVAALQAVPSQRLLVLATARHAERSDVALSRAELLDLSPLDDEQAALAIARLLPRADPFVADTIRRDAGGNPLFIEELCHSAAHDDLDRRQVRLHGGASWLSALIESRLSRLPEALAAVVRAASVIGRVIPGWLIGQVTGCGPGHPVLQELADQDFIFPVDADGSYRFKHGITRDVIYEAVGVHQRRSLHARIAQALQAHAQDLGQEPAHEALAYHWAAAQRADLAARHAEAAGDRAVAVSALDRAKAQYRAALQALDALPHTRAFHAAWASVSGKLALVCVFDASRADLETFRRAVALAMESGDQAAQARALYWLGYISYSLGEPGPAVFQLELAQAGARHVGDEPLAVQVRATLGQAHTAAADYERALPLLDEAISIKRQHRSGQGRNVGLAFTLVCRAWSLGDRGDFQAARADIAEALALVGHLQHEIRASVQGWHSALLLWQGHWVEAIAAAEDSMRIAEETRSLFQLCMAQAMRAYAQWQLQPGTQPVQVLQDATAWLEPREGGLFKSFNHGWLADVLVAGGQAAPARQHAARALQRARHSDLIGVAMACRAMALLDESAGRPQRAAYHLGLAQRVADRRRSPHERANNQLCEAGIALRADRPTQARDLLDQAMAAFERMDMRGQMAQAQALWRLA